MNLIHRRRDLLRTGKWPVMADCPMMLSKILLNGSIINKPDWRSSGYVAVPAGAVKIKVENIGEAYSSCRIGAPETTDQTTDILMLNGGNVTTVGQVYELPVPSAYVYISRVGDSTAPIRITFYDA